MHLRSRKRSRSIMGMVALASALLGSSAMAQNLIEGPPPKAPLKNPDAVGSTLDFPTGDFQDVDILSRRGLNLTAKPKVVWDDILRVNDVAWLRLYFSEVRLEGNSFIRVTSLLDGEVQELDSNALSMWKNSTAYFNGNAVKIELVAAPFSIDNEIRINRYAFEVGTADRGEGNCGICGADDRAPSSNPNMARLMPVGCSATLHNEDSCMVTAGHCLGQGGVVQFNVPASNNDGSTNNPPVSEQFPVLAEQGVDAGVGADYGALSIGTNNEGLTPYEKYNTFIPLASSIPNSGTISVNGYGVDSGQPSRSQTQQFHDGPVMSVSGSAISYDIDVTFGNSGSSLVYNGEIIGVVTHCSGGCENYGTRIDDAGFVQIRDIICNGEEPPPGGCAPGEIEDCEGNCCPADWVGDNYCDDGSYDYNGNAIFLNCDEFNCDGGDCPPESCGGGGDPTGACCIGNKCSVVTAAVCSDAGGDYLGDGTNCNNQPCGGGGDPTGACCIGTSKCFEGLTSDECANLGGKYVGNNTNCAGSPCGGGGGDGGEAYLDITGIESFDGYQSGVNVIATVTVPAGAEITGIGWNDVTLSAIDPSWGSEAGIMFNWENNGEPFAGYTAIFDGEDAPGEYGPATGFTDLSADYNFTDADGQIQIEFFETYDDAAGVVDSIWTGGSIYVAYNGGGGGDPSGACCVANKCSVRTAADCAAAGGDYLGDGTNCTDDPCGGGGEPTGACCVDTDCSVETEVVCSLLGGQYLGDGTNCNGEPCGGGGGGDGDTCGTAVNASVGTNPFDTSSATDSGYGEPDDSQCAGTYLDWQGSPDYWMRWNAPGTGTANFTTCDANSYDTSLVLYQGSSCNDLIQVACNGDSAAADPGCQQYYSEMSFEVVGGQTYFIRIGGWQGATGAGTLTISGDFGGEPSGACCVQGTCAIETQLGCLELGGDYLGDGTDCSNSPCASLGACCLGLECLEVTPDQCADNGGDYYGDGSSCDNITCEEPPVTGACCVGNSCFAATADDCSSASGDYQGDNTNCADTDCGGGIVTGACCTGTSCVVVSAGECLTIGGDYLGDDSNCDDDPCGGTGGEISVRHSIVGTNLLSTDEPNWTVDLFITMSADQRLDAVAGTPEQQKMLTCSTSFYQNANGGPTSVDVNPNFFEFDPDLEWDSRVSIGCIDSSGFPFPENNVQNIGIDWVQFENGNDLSVGNGLWFILPDDVAGTAQPFTADDCSIQYGVHLGRLTIIGDGEVGFEGFAQGRDADGNIFGENVSTFFGYTETEDCNGNFVSDACDIANGTSEDANGNGIPDECDDSCPGDADGDGDSDVDDILIILGLFGNNTGEGDLTGDGVCNVDDILLLLSFFGDC